MSPTFWSNTIWFILLGISTIIELAVIFLKVKSRKLVLALYLTISGMAFCYEMIIYAYFKSYKYFPMLIPQSPPDDSIAGNLFSQFSVSATALLIAVFDLRYYWFIILAATYGVIEELFIKLGIFQHNWYQTWMTVVGLLLFFGITKKIYKESSKHIRRFLRYLYIFFGLVTLHEHSIVWVQRLIGVRVFSETFLPEKEQSLVVLAAINLLLLGVIIMTIYFSNIKWSWRIPVIFVIYVAFLIAARLDLIIYKEGWFFISSSICIWGMYLYTYILDRLYDRT
ncbi:MAG: hypothetical protein HPY50_02805 [Firmicutes bacterium]|nr:hypothetical protein [Bacillota bacterium]